VRDPIHLVRRYQNPADAEVAAVFGSTLAFGRMEAFLPVVQSILTLADTRGGPASWVTSFEQADADALSGLNYRWLRGGDIALLARAVGHMCREHGRLGTYFAAGLAPEHRNTGPALDRFILALRSASVSLAGVSSYAELPRGFRHCLPRPADGSGCKRWNMLLRWMIRRPTHPSDPDLGIWKLPTAKLVIPVDTHVLRVARLIGLTHRTDGSWRTALEITENLARIDPQDPVRYDFALAHLGISGGCRSKHLPAVCGPCPLSSCCRFGRAPRRVSRPSGGDA
jgi:uncharacterized protein (TIGR02757 family)